MNWSLPYAHPKNWSLRCAHPLQVNLDEIILSAHGFAEVMPEHKFEIVQRLREQGHVTGMTGDGVNDAPALKRADIGIAVHGATDAAKAAADIVLTEPGLSVIIDAIFRSRKIFQRMRNYCLYRISCTIQLLFFFFFAILTINPTDSYFYGSNPNNIPELVAPAAFTLPVISLVIITILNDGTMITIAHDKVIPEKIPQRWAMFEVTIVSLVLGLVACLSSMIMLVGILHVNYSNPGECTAHEERMGPRLSSRHAPPRRHMTSRACAVRCISPCRRLHRLCSRLRRARLRALVRGPDDDLPQDLSL